MITSLPGDYSKNSTSKILAFQILIANQEVPSNIFFSYYVINFLYLFLEGIYKKSF
jgi:hypothetical protein